MMGKVLLAVIMIGMCAPATAASGMAKSSPFTFAEEPGRFAVGLRVADLRDTSRAFGKAHSRPLQTLVWYPALTNTSPPMTVGDYVRLTVSEPELHTKWMSRVGESLDGRLRAIRNASPAQGRYPVVIYAPSDSSVSWENADICEYLASHGYIVIASPSMGADTLDMTDDLPGIEAQARDISFLIDYAKTLSDSDMSAIAVAAFSWGGLADLFAAARDERIDALVALDGSMRYFPGLVKRADYVHPEKMHIPLLAFTRGEITLEIIASQLSAPENIGPSVLNAWTHGDLLTVEMFAMAHQQFSSMLERRPTHYVDDEIPGYTWEEGSAGYVWVARYTLYFLDAYLKHDVSSLARLKAAPATNGVPRHVMNASFRPANSPDVVP